MKIEFVPCEYTFSLIFSNITEESKRCFDDVYVSSCRIFGNQYIVYTSIDYDVVIVKIMTDNTHIIENICKYYHKHLNLPIEGFTEGV